MLGPTCHVSTSPCGCEVSFDSEAVTQLHKTVKRQVNIEMAAVSQNSQHFRCCRISTSKRIQPATIPLTQIGSGWLDRMFGRDNKTWWLNSMPFSLKRTSQKIPAKLILSGWPPSRDYEIPWQFPNISLMNQFTALLTILTGTQIE